MKSTLGKRPKALGTLRLNPLTQAIGGLYAMSAARLALAMGAGLLLVGKGWAQTVSVPVNALPKNPTVVSGSFQPGVITVTGNTGTIVQNSNAGIVKWDSFDIGKNAAVQVNMPSASSVLLNEVLCSGCVSKTVIDGLLKSNGQIYIYNPNGVLIGKTAVVDVNSLVASTLKIEHDRLLAGLVAPSNRAQFEADVALGYRPGDVSVDAGASITAANGGRVMLLAPNVINNGQITAPDGQIILAAGDRIFLATPKDANMRGLLVEVGNNVNNTSSVTNGVTGQLGVGRGNATMVAQAVNQMGTVSATTSVNLNGSVWLKAQSTSSQFKGGNEPSALPDVTSGGDLTLGQGSKIRIDVADDGTTASFGPNDVKFKPSDVQLQGKTITLQDNASIIAHGGNVSMTAVANPSTPNFGGQSQAGVKVDLGANSLIDVSGTTDTQLDMSSNLVKVELRGNELADNPVLRDGTGVRGKTAYVDARVGTQIGNVQGYLDARQYTVGEKTATGGNVTIKSEGEVIQRAGSKIDVSGGQVAYKDGYVNTSKLVRNGSLVDIGKGVAGVVYDDVTQAPPGAGSFEAGYVDGKSAGAVSITASQIALQGDMAGAVVRGPYQRDIASSSYPQGGQLKVDGYAGNNIRLNGTATDGVVAGDTLAGTALADTLDIKVDKLAAAGFNQISVKGEKANVTVDGPIKLDAGGKLSISSNEHVNINRNISIAGGTVAIDSVNPSSGDVMSGVAIADDVKIDLAGTWTNDRNAAQPTLDAASRPTSTVVTKGGTFSVGNADVITTGKNVSIDVSGGAWLKAQSGASIIKGDAGAITLTLVPKNSGSITTTLLTLGQGTSFFGYSLGKGGTLTLTAQNVLIGSAPASGFDVSLTPDFFSQGGFNQFNINALNNVQVADGTVVTPRADSWVKHLDAAFTPSGSMRQVADVGRLDLTGPLAGRQPVSVSLNAKGNKDLSDTGNLLIGKDAVIQTDPQATVSLAALRQLTVNGTIDAPAGTIKINGTGIPTEAATGVLIGKDAKLKATGTADQLYVTSAGKVSGDLLGGGQISITSSAGSVVVEQGAQLDVSGANAPSRYGSTTAVLTSNDLVSNAGSIDISAQKDLAVAGTLKGQAGGAGALGGTLSFTLTRSTSSTADRDLVIGNTALSSVLPSGTLAKSNSGLSEGQGVVTTQSFASGGFDALNFKSTDAVSFDVSKGDVTLSAGAHVAIDAPIIRTTGTQAGNTVTLEAAHVQLGTTDFLYQGKAATTSASGGKDALVVRANTIDLTGNTVVQGVDQVSLNADQDIRLSGQFPFDVTPGGQSNVHLTGSFAVGKDLTLNSAQVYTTTLSEFKLDAAHQIDNNSNGRATSDPLSAAGVLTAHAAIINQNGRLLSPFGAINLVADTALNYGDGSVTSVAGNTLVPFGLVQNGATWVYDFGGTLVEITTDPSHATTSTGVTRALPQKQISSRAPSVSVSSGAKLDVSGGGDLYAYEFTAGPGGSRDVLAKPSTTGAQTTTFAILPGFASAYSPKDMQYSMDGGLQIGNQVYLSGVNGLPAGNYTLLPAHYALLPGAYSISVISGSTGALASGNGANIDGSLRVAGYRGVQVRSADGSTSLAGGSRSQAFLVTPSSVVRTQSEYTDYSASNFFANQANSYGVDMPRLPQDAGQAIFAARDALNLAGQIALGASKGRRGEINISGNVSGNNTASDVTDISITSAGSPVAATGLTLSADQLSKLNAESVIIGAERTNGANGSNTTTGSTLNVSANKVTLANDAAHPLTAPEVVLAARDTVELKDGAMIVGAGKPGATPRAMNIAGSGADADGALLRVSGGAQTQLSRTAPAQQQGTLEVASTATIKAEGSVITDATFANHQKGKLDLGSQGQLAIGAGSISLVADNSTGQSGLVYSGSALDQLSQGATLNLTSYSSIDFYGDVALGNDKQQLTLNSASLRGFGSRNASITAAALSMGNAGNNTAPTTGSPLSGSLTIKADSLQLTNGVMTVDGYQTVNATVKGDVLGAADKGKTGGINTTGDLALSAGRITAAAGSTAQVQAAGQMDLAKSAGSTSTNASPLGGVLNFIARQFNSSAQVEAHSGQINVTAEQGINLQNGANLDASGVTRNFDTATAYSAGGTVKLDGGRGDVVIGNGATVDVSATGNDAGTVLVKASTSHMTDTTNDANNEYGNSTFVLSGTLKGSATAVTGGNAVKGGKVNVDVDQLASLGDLNSKLNQQGVSGSRDFRIRNQDAALNAGESIAAQHVGVQVDNGNLTVNGTIDARGSQGGDISLYAGQRLASGNKGKVTIGNGAVLNAAATTAATTSAGSTGDGGKVEIATGNVNGAMPSGVNGGNSLALNGGSIDVSGKGAGQAGSVILRAPRTGEGAGSDVAISNLQTTISGSGQTSIEGYKVYNATKISEAADSATNLNAGTSGKMYTEANSFDGNKSAILSRLNPASSANVAFTPGVEVRSSGDLAVSVSESSANRQDRGWNLNAWRFGAAQDTGVLTLRAAGNLDVNGSISDGFIKPNATVTTSADKKTTTVDYGGGLVMTYNNTVTGGVIRTTVLATSVNNVAMPAWVLDTKNSWSYRIAAGADFSGSALSVNQGSGDFSLGFARTSTTTDPSVALIRTGTGSIQVAAGNNINMAAEGDPSAPTASAVIYTAGKRTSSSVSTPVAGFTAPVNAENPAWFGVTDNSTSKKLVTATSTTRINNTATFPDQGGAIFLRAGGDINGAMQAQLVNQWLFRQGRVDSDGNFVAGQNTAWWPRFDYFSQGVATFAGGNVSAQSGGNINNLAMSAASNAFMPGSTPSASNLLEHGGGDVDVTSAGNLNGGVFYVQKGNGQIVVGGSTGQGALGAYPILALGDGQWQVRATGDAVIETVLNPTLIRQSTNQVASYNPTNPGQYSTFYTYTANSGVDIQSTGGNVVFNNDLAKIENAAGSQIAGPVGSEGGNNKTFESSMSHYPGSVRAVAYGGDVKLAMGGFSMAPSANGDLQMLAGNNVVLKNSGSTGRNITMLDANPSLLPGIANPRPVIFADNEANQFAGSVEGTVAHTDGGLHSADSKPVQIVANNGDVVGDPDVQLVLPKQTNIHAGRDVVDVSYAIQNNNASDVSRVSAGRDVVDSTIGTGTNAVHIITGPGRLEIAAGRDVNLGNGKGIDSRGNLDNPYLPSTGANVQISTAQAGLQYDQFVQQFIATHLAELTAQQQLEQDLAKAYQDDLRRSVIAYMGASTDLTLAQAWQQFTTTQSVGQQQVFRNQYSGLLNGINTYQDVVDLSTRLSRTPLDQAMVAYMQGISGASSISNTRSAWTAFAALNNAQRAAFYEANKTLVNGAYFDSIAKLTGVKGQYNADLSATQLQYGSLFPSVFNQSTGVLNAFNSVQMPATFDVKSATDLARYDALLNSLFVVDSTSGKVAGGNINLTASMIKTERGGAIDLLAPGGSVYAGFANPPAYIKSKPAAELGIFTVQGGEIRSIVDVDFLVNQSRVFTLGGGDITLVSRNGDLSAGKGAKTAAATPPPLLTTDKNGNTTLDLSGSISGSGIATLKTNPNVPDASVYPVSPRGTFDAGDAGVRSTGTVNIVAAQVLGADNISAKGGVSGAAVDSGASTTAASSATTTNAGTRSDDLNKNSTAGNTTLAVEVTGYGGESTSAGDPCRGDKSRSDCKNKN